MKAPDKIYIPVYPNHNLDGVHLGDDWMYEPHKECDNVEYIRKGALIEWVNKMLQDTADRLDFHSNQAFAQLFDKLNSM